ncbi:MAG: general secretion pathway protein GspK [Planctomycetaceae bacterium]|nr:general secretion pathway protein GspK [Planctomycetaceae bacterium]
MSHRRQGLALIMVLVVIAMLSLSAYTFTSLMLAENESAILHGKQLQSRAAVDSGVAHARYFLEQDVLTREDLGGSYYNPTLFQAQLVVDHSEAKGRARFAILAPELSTDGYWGGMRFGLEDESSRLNLNALDLEVPDFFGEDLGGDLSGALDGGETSDGAAAGGRGGGNSDQDEDDDESEMSEEEEEVDTSGRGLLMQMPGMTVDIADAILDWIDEDDEPRQYGAEIDYYSSLPQPYAPKNGPLETLEELLLVRGVTPDLLFGRDQNRNGLIDLQEQQLLIIDDDGSGELDRGWSSYLTLYSMEKNVSSDGIPRIDLNGDDLALLFEELAAALGEPWATFIIAYRQFGPYKTPGQGGDEIETEPAGNQPLDFSKSGRVPITQVLDLIGVQVRAQLDGEEDAVILESPFPDQPFAYSSYLPQLMDYCTVVPDTIIPGRVNINQAPFVVLMTIPGVTEQIANDIIAERDIDNSEFDPDFQHETWLMSRSIVSLDEMREMMPYVTAGGDVFRAQIVGYFDEGEIASRSEVIFDATSAAPRILFWRDISHLGRGYPVELLGVDLTNSE